jgi:hypothetical protein
MAVKRNATWNIKKKAVVNTLADARADVLKNLQDDIAELTAAGNIIKTKRINPDFADGFTQVWLGRGVYQAEVIEIDTVVLSQLLTDLQSVESDITAGLYDAGISAMQAKMQAQMSRPKATSKVVVYRDNRLSLQAAISGLTSVIGQKGPITAAQVRTVLGDYSYLWPMGVGQARDELKGHMGDSSELSSDAKAMMRYTNLSRMMWGRDAMKGHGVGNQIAKKAEHYREKADELFAELSEQEKCMFEIRSDDLYGLWTLVSRNRKYKKKDSYDRAADMVLDQLNEMLNAILNTEKPDLTKGQQEMLKLAEAIRLRNFADKLNQ